MDRRMYFYFNLLIAGIIILGGIYASFFASSNYSLHCTYKQITGSVCPTCGLTRAFNYILQGKFKDAASLNRYSLQLFTFFAIQLLLRLALLLQHFFGKKTSRLIIRLDTLFSILLFLICFWPLLFLSK
ncbi:MAG: DUF2752 domain-containing protein [Filimonas sp.]|nr:DUF2752 domain-containing protein [Filimonas sp.]